MTNLITIRPGDENYTPIVKEAIAKAQPGSENVIEFEKGTYYFKKAGSDEYTSFSSGGKSQKNNIIFPLVEKNNVTIKGNGSEFIFCDRVQPFKIQSCENVKLQDFSIDFSFLRYAYAEVLAVCDEGVEIKLDNEIFDYYIDGGNICFVCGEEVLSTRLRKISTKRIAPTKGYPVFLYVGDFDGAYNRAAQNILLDAEETSRGIFLRYRKNNCHKMYFEPGDTVCLAYDNDREMQAFYCDFSKNITLENVSIFRQGGMGFVADICENIKLDRFKIAIKDGRREYYSTTADGIFLTNCKGEFSLVNSAVSSCYDDAMNVHGFYTETKEILPGNRVEIIHAYEDHWGLLPFLAGDELAFSTKDSFDQVAMAKITDVYYAPDRMKMIVTLDKIPDNLTGGMLVENVSRMPNVTVEGCRIENCPHIRLSAPEMLIRNNYFNLSATDLYICDLIDFWRECGAVKHALIENNEFGSNSPHNIEILSCRPDTSNHLHENIIVRGNVFEKKKENALKVSGITNFVEENNVFGIK